MPYENDDWLGLPATPAQSRLIGQLSGALHIDEPEVANRGEAAAVIEHLIATRKLNQARQMKERVHV